MREGRTVDAELVAYAFLALPSLSRAGAGRPLGDLDRSALRALAEAVRKADTARRTAYVSASA